MFRLDISYYNITREGEIINKRNGHILKQQKNGKGYMRVSIGGTRYFVHRLVAEKYIPNPENKPQINHIDGNKANNSAENLEWVTNQENRDHAISINLHFCGEKCSYAKLTEKDVLFIRENQDKFSRTELAKKFGVSRATIRDVINRRSWKHL